MIVVRKELCPQNHACPTLRICPVGAIVQKGFSAPTVDQEKCICCCKCVTSCAVFVPIACCQNGPDPRM
jgi:ferredoxin